MPAKFELDELDFSLRGKLLRMAFGESIGQIRFAGATKQEIERAIDEGQLTVLFDDQGKFIKDSVGPLPGTP